MNGCHDRPEFQPGYPVQDGWFTDGVTRYPRMVWARHVTTTDCQYKKTATGAADPKCAGCKWRTKNAMQSR